MRKTRFIVLLLFEVTQGTSCRASESAVSKCQAPRSVVDEAAGVAGFFSVSNGWLSGCLPNGWVLLVAGGLPYRWVFILLTPRTHEAHSLLMSREPAMSATHGASLPSGNSSTSCWRRGIAA